MGAYGPLLLATVQGFGEALWPHVGPLGPQNIRFFGFAKIVNSLLGPVMNLGRGHSCQKSPKSCINPLYMMRNVVKKLLSKKYFWTPFPKYIFLKPNAPLNLAGLPISENGPELDSR